jgi:hypothetical protein
MKSQRLTKDTLSRGAVFRATQESTSNLMTEEEALEVADLGGTILVSRVVAEGPEDGSAFQVLLATAFALQQILRLCSASASVESDLRRSEQNF